MAARYLVRFDDLCPTANWPVWRDVEALLNAHGVKPMVAVVPDNRDPELVTDAAPIVADEFWAWVRAWQSRGWAIGLHGYQHRYVTREAGIIGRNRYSEFCGLSESEQRRKIEAGLAIFETHGVKADVWIAPAHSLDSTTVRVLAAAGLDCISDGYSLRPFLSAEGQFWVPQQIARFRPMPSGVWTVCLHVNRWTSADVARFDADLARYSASITTLAQVRLEYGKRRMDLADVCLNRFTRLARSLKGKLATEGATTCTSPL